MSDRLCHLTLPLLDSCTQFSTFEDSSTSLVMANASEDVNEAGVRVGIEASDKVMKLLTKKS
ncbi:hypothetical protein RHMOL_Rhmol03G0128100 [Rhododendron molle]|uniref:Uncharacterized protein n=1 Tax=Rhododendron molle TaxID=49168 RepID=A0ACC0PF40_RHOML|nr:hypothetical protein RHMOL_Rhmol03G0128100 [Rhododendron molle]